MEEWTIKTWIYIHSLLVFSTQIVNCRSLVPMHERTKLVYCCPSTFSLTSTPLPPSQSKCSTVYMYVCTDSVRLWSGGVWRVLSCVVDHILQEFNTLFLTRFRTYKIVRPPKTKMTRKDDI
jgi:hypothetical protein